MDEPLSTELYMDRLSLLGRLTARVTHAVNNTLSGVIGLVEIASEEGDPNERRMDLEESLRALRPASRMVMRLLEFAAPSSDRTEAFALILERFLELAACLRRPSTISHDCSIEAGAVPVPVAPLEHLLLASLAMISDRAAAETAMNVQGRLDGDLRITITASPLKSCGEADKLDALQRPRWERMAEALGGKLQIGLMPGRLRFDISWPAGPAQNRRQEATDV